ncbi:MAG: hypothetical protein QM715_09110 [Nibricoccus sp.]
MTFSNDTQLTDVTRLTRHLVLATLLAAPIPSYATLQTSRHLASSIRADQHAPAPVARQRTNRTYLAMVGPAALTFANTELPLPPEPVMPEPPKPKHESSQTASANSTTGNAAVTSDTAALKPATETPDSSTSSNNNGSKPISILPDDTRREIRAEDVLPYFQFPGSADSSSVIINPAPAAAPPSTATYRQQ